MPSEKEKDIENRILRFCNVAGIFAWKVQSVGIYDAKKKAFRKSHNPYHINGVSDIGAVFKGRGIACEVKDEKGTLSKDQRIYIAKFNDSGGIGFVARSLWQFVDEISKHFPQDADRFTKIANHLEVRKLEN